jgi:type I restriction enzyme R subunit
VNEAETRKKLIDEKLRLAGWNVNDPTHVTLELDIDLKAARNTFAEPKTVLYGCHQFADYGLLLHGKPVAVVEAKRTSKDAELGQEQAVQYAKNLQAIHGGHQPFIMYTNGYDTFFWESDFYPPVKVHGFPNRDDLDWLNQRRGLRNPLSVELINTSIAGRGYQIEAIRSILELIEAKRRRFLFVMATGTGKTRTAVALVDVLRRAKWAKRVLFLVDRIALQEQALDAFKEHIPSEARWPKDGENTFAKDRRLYVTTYPTMLNLIEGGTTPATRLSPFFFDLIIADESHRSIYNIYQQVLDYFHAIILGLTATPTDHIEHDTFELFECAKNDPTFAFTYEEAVEHKPPYLCDFEVLKVRSKFQLKGIKEGTIPPAMQKKLIAEGRDIADINFEGSDLERKVTNSGTNAVIVREFMEESIKDHTGTLPGKTIFFAISKGHARRLQTLFDRMYPEHAGKLARVLVSEDRFVYGKGGLLDQFKTEDMPRVAISVDMLDTGVDVPEVVNLVFAKPVYSFTKFWQMIGRGTRILNDDLAKRKSWCPEKEKFLIIDCWGNFEFFKMKPKGREPGGQVPLPVRLFRARLDKLEAALAAGADAVAENAKADLRADLATLHENNVVVSEAKVHLDAAAADAFWKTITAESLGFLRSVIAPVLRARSAADSKGMRFEIDAVETGTALVSGNNDRLDAVKISLLEQVAELPLTVNLVAKEQPFIDDFQTPNWWVTITDDKLREAVARLVPLMKYRQRKRDGMVHLDITDLVTVKEWIEFGPEHERLSTSAYRERIESFIRDLVKTNPSLQKLQQGEELTGAEVKALANLLAAQDPYVTEELLRKVYDHKTARFIRFLKHILGLELLGSWEETVTAAFEGFIGRHNTFSAMQLRFIQTLKTFVLQTGRATKKDLIDAPFTQIHPNGIRGVFQPAEINEILAFTEELVA